MRLHHIWFGDSHREPILLWQIISCNRFRGFDRVRLKVSSLSCAILRGLHACDNQAPDNRDCPGTEAVISLLSCYWYSYEKAECISSYCQCNQWCTQPWQANWHDTSPTVSDKVSSQLLSAFYKPVHNDYNDNNKIIIIFLQSERHARSHRLDRAPKWRHYITLWTARLIAALGIYRTGNKTGPIWSPFRAATWKETV